MTKDSQDWSLNSIHHTKSTKSPVCILVRYKCI